MPKFLVTIQKTTFVAAVIDAVTIDDENPKQVSVHIGEFTYSFEFRSADEATQELRSFVADLDLCLGNT